MKSIDAEYAQRLAAIQQPLWKRILDVQRPYRWNLRRLNPGRTLDIGCGIGRNLAHLGKDAVGVDPNETCVAAARAAGFTAFTPAELPAATYESLLFSHVLEHVEDPAGLISAYLPFLLPLGQIILITPQESGYASDPTHVRFLDLAALRAICESLGLSVSRAFSFPFPRSLGRAFKYNEFVLTAVKPD